MLRSAALQLLTLAPESRAPSAGLSQRARSASARLLHLLALQLPPPAPAHPLRSGRAPALFNSS